MSDYEDVEENQQLTGAGKKPKYIGIERQPVVLRVVNRKVILVGLVVLVLVGAIVLGVVLSRNDSDGNGNGTPAIWENIRLPGSVVPSQYNLYLHPNLTTFNYTGNVDISVQVVTATDTILIHSSGLDISSTQLLTSTNALLSVARTFYYEANEFYVIQLESIAPVGTYSLKLGFAGTLRNDLFGFYRSSYTDSNNQTKWIATTQFEPVDARRAFPCFDEPAMKASFTLTMVRDANMVALGNMPVAQTTDFPGNPNLKVDLFQQSVKMSTYLVAFVVCDFVSIQSTTSRGVKVAIWTPPNKIAQAEVALQVTTSILDFYETFFNVSYPLPKQDMIAIPDFNAGAMENWGLITYRETALLVDTKASSASDVQRAVTVIAHELAHQWFGNLVTMKWWNDLWLNEGFASFVEYIGVNHVNSSWDMDTQFLILSQDIALSLDSLESSHPIEFVVNNPNEINQLFDSISYDKGASVIRMCYNMMGPANFLKGITSYLNTYRYGNAETNQLWASLSQYSTLPITEIMNDWTSQVGYPVISVTANNVTKKAFIQQSRFFLIPPAQPPAISALWRVPLTYSTAADVNNLTSLVFGTPNVTIDFPLAGEDWYLLNVYRHGFYRVNYDSVNWQRLSAALSENPYIMSASARAGLLNDAFAFSRSGLIDLTFPLDFARFLSKELDYTVWSEAITGISFFGTQLRWQPSYGAFQDYFASLVVPAANLVGWLVNVEQDPQTTRLLRSSILSTAAITCSDKDAISNATALFRAFMNDPVNNAVSADLRDVVYVIGVMYGDKEEWEFLWNQYRSANVAAEQRRILRALAATRVPWLLNRLLSYTLDSTKIKSQDVITAIVYVASRTQGESVAWNFLRTNWETFVEMLGGGSFSLGDLVEGVVARFQTQQLYDEVKAFFAGKELGSAALALDQSLESIAGNIEWLANNQKKIEDFLQYAGFQVKGAMAA